MRFVLLFFFCLFLTGCQTTDNLISCERPVKIVNPKAPFVDENIDVFEEHLDDGIKRNAGVVATLTRVPVDFFKEFRKKFNGVSDRNPYRRSKPYYKRDFEAAQLADQFGGVLQPDYIRGVPYVNPYHSPFMFKEEFLRGGTKTMVELKDIDKSLLAKEYINLQKDLDIKLDRAEKLLEDKDFSGALKLVDEVLDIDMSSYRARVLFEKIIKAREEERIKKEEEIKKKIANEEKIAKYLNEAKEYLMKQEFSEAERLARKALSVDPSNEKARSFLDNIELAKFEYKLKESGTSSLEVLERMIYKHLSLYQEYKNEGLLDLAEKELKRVSILEDYRDKISEKKGCL